MGCELRGDPDVTVDSVGPLSQAGPRAITFLANPRYRSQLAATRATAAFTAAGSVTSAWMPFTAVGPVSAWKFSDRMAA